ncbi:MAG: hypothetical protein V2J14_11455 [Erythrobacter sp.]|jgi:hypothetical protein|nr:hypothetical protein [Erythrobacter sp.]
MLQLLAFEYRSLLQDVLAYSVCLAALIWGAGPERAIAATWLIVFELFTALFRNVLDLSYQLDSIDAYLALSDTLAGGIWLMIALNANRNYPLFIAALQVLAVSAHLARGLIESISPVAYATMVIAPGWLQLILLGIGVIAHRLRVQRYGEYREWRVPVNWLGLTPAKRGNI